ncbi:MAG TPA: PAS domain-containing protein [Anaerolineae bacterium]|nr:PAS domain-containing protein [Anaerolineae bacterium]
MKQLPGVLEGVRQVVEGLVGAIGIPCEVVLHDLRDPSQSIVAISGDITGRSVGGPTTDLILRLLRSKQVDSNLIGYPSQAPDGKILRSSTIFIHDESGVAVGCLCINIDITYWQVARHLLENLCDTSLTIDSSQLGAESFEPSVTDVLVLTVKRALDCLGQPIARVQKQEKLEVVRMLDQEGIFLIRGAVDYVADALGVSRPTVYNYLAELRNTERFGTATGQSPSR